MFQLGIMTYIKIAGVLLILTIGYFGYRYVTNLQEENAELQVSVANLENTVKAKDQEILQQKQTMDMMTKETEAIRKSEVESQKSLKALRKKLNDVNYLNNQKVQREKEAQKLLENINTQQRCLYENFDNYGVDCGVEPTPTPVSPTTTPITGN